MPFTLPHILVSHRLDVLTHENGPEIFFSVAAEGGFQLLYPGRLDKAARATVRHAMRIETPDTTVPDPPGGIDSPGRPRPRPRPTPQPLHNGVQVNEEAIQLDLRIFDPDAQPFTREEVTLADLRKFRDLRGTPRGQWRYTLTGRSRVYTPTAALNETVSDPKGAITLSVLETVPSSSAAPLVPRTWLNEDKTQLTFDLNRVGNLLVTILASANPLTGWRGSVRLIDPDGVRFASSTTRQLRCAIPLSALGKSRDPAGSPRLWTLDVTRQGSLMSDQTFITATVLGEGRIGIAALQERIQTLIGPDGSFIQMVGENSGGDAKAVLTIKDVAAAETIDMHGLLDSRLKKEGQSTNIDVDKPMVLYHRSADFDYGLTLDVSTVSLKSINVEIGPGKGLGTDTPVLRLIVRIEGRVKVKWRGQTLAEAKLRGDRLDMEVGIKIDPDGTPRIAQWVTDEPFDIDLNNTVVAALVIAAGVIGGVSAVAIAEYVEEMVNERFAEGAAELFDDPSLAPRILMTLLGTHLTYLPPRFEGSDILFEHIAPLETEPKARRNYAGAIGRTVMRDAVGRSTFMPPTLGDTWAAQNLKSKIDHIVVVMMENRSYDHVLGYRALAPVSDGADGLTPELMAAINDAATPPSDPSPAEPEITSDLDAPVHPLRKAKFPLNAVNLRTRIPKGVGHSLSDVQQQLSGQIDGPGGRRINDPNGFIKNFLETRLGNNPEGVDGVVPFDVLGYYEKNEAEIDPNTAKPVNDLPIYSFLAENYAYCDRYFCSHPGPTLPNRMYSLTGDVQYDRFNVPILDNNHGDNFLLSRAANIHDMLTRRGVSWRVYESNPSVGMLRMFARYATDDVNIRPLDDLAADVATGNLPSVTVVEPAMHHHPQDDDHPDADMYRGQIFIRRVYEALRANPTTWAKTLLLITYDEHGGLYDHVVPPIADVLNAERPDLLKDSPVITGDLTEPPTGGGITAGGGRGPRDVHISPAILDVLLGETGLPPLTPVDTTIEIPYGVRVPTFVVSPWTMPGKGPSIALDHCSILKTILARFCGDEKPFLSDRVRDSQSFESFITAPEPRMDVGDPPVLEQLPITVRRRVSGASETDTPALYRRRMREEQVDFHELTGRLARMLGR